ncbi:hypothetical protein C8Q80DRAFT_1115292 [Daedaleopsis nitida]|nr:hypothetical protein C8Q80DRAFT_1115292 [Daedaleopsis nitida]
MLDSKPVAIFRDVLPLQGTERLLTFEPEDLEFFMKATGISDENELKEHMLAVQREGYMVKPYTCIVQFMFTKLRLPRTSGYPKLLELGRTRQNPILLEVGCCFGVDLRKVVLDGYPVDSIIASDVVPEFWTLGHKLFNSTSETFPVPFVAGDIFDSAFLEPTPPLYAKPATSAPRLSDVKTLSELRGHVSAIGLCAVFHLFSTEEAQLQLARSLASLLSPEPGSMIFGWHNGLPEKGIKKGHSFDMFCHTPESWTELWDGLVFQKGTVKVDVKLVARSHIFLKDGVVTEQENKYLDWVVTRL